MTTKTQTAVPIEYRPAVRARTCRWKVTTELMENEGLATLGLLQQFLKADVETCLVDLSGVEWADPQPLLCLGLVLAESFLDRSCVVLDLGRTSGTQNHCIFLKFMAQQGFLAALGEHACLRVDGETFATPQELSDLRLRLATQPQATHFQNASCVFARILRVDHFRDRHPELQEVVEAFVREAQERAIEGAFGGDPIARDMLFQKLRKLLYELLTNVAEHSHDAGISAYAGVYARVRGPKPLVEANAKAWNELFERGRRIYGQSKFQPNPYGEWLELFICDVGIGLTTRISEWREPDDPAVARDLKAAQQSKNPLESIANRLFRNALSRHIRHDAARTAVTGLQHLGHLLSIGGDYCRIYTQRGCWVGDAMPWVPGAYSRKDIRRHATAPQYRELVPVSGTAYAFSLQPSHRNLAVAGERTWAEAKTEDLAAIREALLCEPAVYRHSKIEFYDRRTVPHCLPPSQEDLPERTPLAIVLRPPRLTSKQDIARWLALVAGDPHDEPIRPVKAFALADLTPFQTLAFRELLLNVKVHSNTRLDIYLVSDHWAVSCVNTVPGETIFCPADDMASAFTKCPDLEKGQPFWVGDLAILLRQMDSEIFWASAADHPQSFFEGSVIWSTSDQEPITLRRYLDFPHALADPSRYRACRRALRRCLALFPDHKPVGADDLVASLVSDALVGRYTESANATALALVVGSIAITGGTVSRLKEELGGDAMHVMIHCDAQGVVPPSDLVAMLWISQLPKSRNELHSRQGTDSQLSWRRIPNTPFIAPLGEHSRSLMRYGRTKDGRMNFNAPLYGRTPQETYDDYQRLGVLKTGHWTYGSHHDLLTINTGLAFRFSFLELGPLHRWIREQFAFFFSAAVGCSPRAQLLIYPSHPVTDSMLDRIRQDPAFKDVLPQGGMIPVKFLGQHTVSPLLASHLVAHEIEQQALSSQWEDWSGVVVDDGAVSGKHLRELRQFLQGLGARTVYTLALLDRTGLPAQEAVIPRYFQRHKRFWRWDVPTLGSGRHCPLCQALAIVQTYSHRLSSERQRRRLEEWALLWKARDVQTQWHHSGLVPRRLMPPLPITFGVDAATDGTRNEKRLLLADSTAATSVLLELTRLTTRADTTLKKAALLESTDPDAAIEIISAQLLLFIDELNLGQKRERFMKLLRLIWNRPATSQVMALAGLAITLADHEVVRGLWTNCRSELLTEHRIGNLDALLAVNILRSRYAFLTQESYELSQKAQAIEKHNYIMLGGHGCHREVVSSFLEICRNPTAPGLQSTHAAAIRTRLVELQNVSAQEALSKVRDRASIVLKDVRFVEQIMERARQELIATIPDTTMRELTTHVAMLEKISEEHTCHNRSQSEQITDLTRAASALSEFLFGDSKNPGLLSSVVQQFLSHYDNVEQVDTALVSPIARAIRKKWDALVCAKEADPRNREPSQRWKATEKHSVHKPDFAHSMGESTGKLWLYCDSYVKDAIEEVLSNVFHARERIADPWDAVNTGTDAAKLTAHLWWRLDVQEDFALFRAVNASANHELILKQTVNIAGLERAGGSIGVEIVEGADVESRTLVYTVLRIPRHSFFLKEES